MGRDTGPFRPFNGPGSGDRTAATGTATNAVGPVGGASGVLTDSRARRAAQNELVCMSMHSAFRRIHRWGAVLIAVPSAITLATGILLMFKFDSSWIAPPTQTGVSTDIPAMPIDRLWAAVRAVPNSGMKTWGDVQRIDYRPRYGVAKFVNDHGLEVQVDTATAQVLHVSQRRSDLIESIHTGAFLSLGVKRYVFLPTAVILFVMWLTGIYMVMLPYVLKRRRMRRKRSTP